jgi:colicin import membrane protein
MPGFVREHLRPLIGSTGLHIVLLVALAVGALRWTSTQPPARLAIEGRLVDEGSVPKSALPNPKTPAPHPAPVAAPPPEPVPPAQADTQDAAEMAAKAQAALEAERQRAAEQKAREEAAAAEAQRRQAEAEAERKRQAEAEAERRKQAEEAARKKQAEDAERKRQAEEAARREREAQAQAAKEAKIKADREADLQRQLAAEEEGAAVARSGVVDEYRALLVQTIERNWIRPPSARVGLECTLFVTQAPGGTVIDVKLGTCNGDPAVRESIVNAVYRSSPLPAPRDARAFERRLQIVFKPTE